MALQRRTHADHLMQLGRSLLTHIHFSEMRKSALCGGKQSGPIVSGPAHLLKWHQLRLCVWAGEQTRCWSNLAVTTSEFLWLAEVSTPGRDREQISQSAQRRDAWLRVCFLAPARWHKPSHLMISAPARLTCQCRRINSSIARAVVPATWSFPHRSTDRSACSSGHLRPCLANVWLRGSQTFRLPVRMSEVSLLKPSLIPADSFIIFILLHPVQE
jgi:hypothetical protein